MRSERFESAYRFTFQMLYLVTGPLRITHLLFSKSATWLYQSIHVQTAAVTIVKHVNLYMMFLNP